MLKNMSRDHESEKNNIPILNSTNELTKAKQKLENLFVSKNLFINKMDPTDPNAWQCQTRRGSNSTAYPLFVKLDWPEDTDRCELRLSIKPKPIKGMEQDTKPEKKGFIQKVGDFLKNH